ncbi:hypothetical protein [Flavobacterium sp. RSSB_23]|uniref:hypothetical protein n=1 Tax=Flavobacterium sp. RSSB_23 TaxID=3447668 RepID=UPI003F3F652C
MKKKQMKNFVKVNYNLLATKKLSSTQKLFVSYIIGWQENGKICFETNNTLALKFGMKYGGMRSVITTLNKFDFFTAIKDYDERTGTSGHEITVNIDLLESFLLPDKKTNKIDCANEKSIEELNSEFYETPAFEVNEFKSIPLYHDNDIIDIEQVMSLLNFNEIDIKEFQKNFPTPKVRFEDFNYYFSGTALNKNKEYHKGILISDEQYKRFQKMIANQ